MNLYIDDIVYTMTLIIGSFTKNSIVIASDRLVTVERDNKKEPDEIFDKIYQLNPSTAILFTGNITKSTLTFLRTFGYSNRLERDVTVIRDTLLQQLKDQPLSLDPKEKLQLCLAGFTNKQPMLKIVTMNYGEDVLSQKADNNYFIGGFTNPSYRAQALLIDKGIKSHLSKNKLRKAINDTLIQCIEEFKDDNNNEKLGGIPDIRVLSQK